MLAASMAVLCVPATELKAQETASKLYLNSSFVFPAGRYTSDPTFWIYGGQVTSTGGGNISNVPRIDVGMTDGSDYEKVNFMVVNANVHAKNILFKGCTIDVGSGARISFEDCIFDGVTFTLGSSVSTSSGAGDLFERYRGHLALKNSVLSQVQFQLRGSQNVVMGLTMDQCTVRGPAVLPMVLSRAGLLQDMKLAQTDVVGCSFTQCSYTAPFLAVTRDCVFDSCTLVPGVPLPDITTPLQLSASFYPPETSDQVTAQLTQYVVTPVGQEVSPGCSLTYSIAGGSVSRNELPLNLPARTITSVLPQAIAVNQPVRTPVTTTITNTTVPTSVVTRTPTSPFPTLPTFPTTSDTFSTAMVDARIVPQGGSPDTGLKLMQTSVHGLMILSLSGGEAGSASKIGAIALKGSAGQASSVQFNQPVGDMMTKALEEVVKFAQLTHGGWPRGYQIELSFADKYSKKDGPSAAVACALLLHSLVTGKDLDQAFAVTGDMNADGTVQPIGGVAAKIRGATKGHCKIVGIPSKNESALGDVLLTDGPAPFASIQIFSISHFREAEALALAEKPATTQIALAEMSRVQEVLLNNPSQMGALLRNQHVITKLQQVLKDTPNNLSAKYLLLYANGRVPTLLSLMGSLNAIDDASGALIAAIKADSDDAFDSIGPGSVGSIITRISNLRAKCDARIRPYADSIVDFGSIVKEVQERPAQTYAKKYEQRKRIYNAANLVRGELDRLMNDPQIREELER
ncbi:S16 family serine protease [Roseimicrobium sp. ORNL1]|uniref:S16 family serine protease n=1 Tax=Roseimicrobium sp. ORNL1 TaxID=2711231 RepID=UPI0013E14997|nr:S16 family serine protease [Roseimicrobium sp. ORNL1]QIF02109.1 hypothetical protein G5S37_11380 [Roseimicrobium sp. ORNL1]